MQFLFENILSFLVGSVEENTNTETLVRRLLSADYADKVIVTTIQKLGLALDGNHKKNYKERLNPLSKKRMVFIFDECHRSQFGENHKAIKEFFPNANCLALPEHLFSMITQHKRHFSMSGLSFNNVEALNEVSVFPLPVVCHT